MNIITGSVDRSQVLSYLNGKQKAPAEIREQVDAFKTLAAGLDDKSGLHAGPTIAARRLTAAESWTRLSDPQPQPVAACCRGEWRPLRDFDSVLQTYHWALDQPGLHLAHAVEPGAKLSIRAAGYDDDFQTCVAVARLGTTPGIDYHGMRDLLRSYFVVPAMVDGQSRWNANPASHPCIAETTDGGAVGFSVVSTDNRLGRGGAVVDFLVATPQAEGLGVQEQLLSDAIHTAEKTGAASCAVEVPTASACEIEMYGRFGFIAVEARPDYYGGGRDGVIMERAL